MLLGDKCAEGETFSWQHNTTQKTASFNVLNGKKSILFNERSTNIAELKQEAYIQTNELEQLIYNLFDLHVIDNKMFEMRLL